MSHTILIIDDEAPIRSALRGILEDEAYQVLEAEGGEQGLALLDEHPVSAVLLDIWMEGMDGLETLRRIKQGPRSELPVIMMSGHGTIDTAVEATKSGAYDFLEKPLSLDRVLLLLERAIRELTLVRENKALKERVVTSARLVGDTPVMQGLEGQIKRVAPTDMWVLITGEPGTGKEVAARRIHELSGRARGPFVVVSSAALPEEHIESELFGHEKGAVPGAVAARAGRFEQANGGTLFLDEIADMSLKTQAKILGILQERRFERVGGVREVEVDVRVIAASNRDLEAEVAQGRLRGDLYYRLNVVPIRMPPLRERGADIPLLVKHFIELNRGVLPQLDFHPAVLERMQEYAWPGNVRELKNLVERLLIMSPGPAIGEGDLPDFLKRGGSGGAAAGEPAAGGGDGMAWGPLLEQGNFREAREWFEREYLRQQLDRNGGNISRTADVIGMERSALHRKLKALGLG